MKICVVTYARGIDDGDDVVLVTDRTDHAESFFRGFRWRKGPGSTERLMMDVWEKLPDGNFRRERLEGRHALEEEAS